jgi:hypothetical protein
MKKLFVVLFVVFFAATSAYALDFQTKGMFNTRGSWISNDSGRQTDAVDYGYYDMELDITNTIVVDDNTKIIVNYEIHDENWGSDQGSAAGGYDGYHTDPNDDDNIDFKRVFSSFTFTSTGTTLDLGLMTGGAWATDFGNTADGKYRVKVTQSTPIGPLFAILEKRAELGSNNSSEDDAEKDDNDAYFLAMVTKLGPVNFKPLLGYIHLSNIIQDQGSDGIDVWTLQLGFDASFDVWGFESDFIYAGYDNDAPVNGGTDQDTYGAYVNAWFKTGPAKLYGTFAYSNYDEGRAFNVGDDFEPLVFWGNWTAFGPIADTTSAMSMYILGAQFAATDALSFNGAIAYLDSNADDFAYWDGADAWEFDLGLDYKISDAVTYTVAFGVTELNVDNDNAGEDPDTAWRLLHKFQINF